MLKTSDTLETTRLETPALAFLGVGWIGKNRLDSINSAKSGKIAMIVEPQESARELLKKEYDSAVYGYSIEDIIQSANIDGVVIASPNFLHAEQAAALLNNGIPVFCQKPLGRNASETSLVVKAAEKNNKLLGVDLSYRSTAAYRKLLEVVHSGEAGDIFSVDLVFHNAYGPNKEWFYQKEQSGGGCVIDLGIHLIDLALYTFNFPAVKRITSNLYSKGKFTKRDEVEDYAAALIELQNGTSLRLNCSWNLSIGCSAVIETTFYGTKGSVSLKNINGSFYDFQTELNKGTSKEIICSPPDDWSGRAVNEWVNKLTTNNEFDSSANEYIKTAEVIDKIYGSVYE